MPKLTKQQAATKKMSLLKMDILSILEETSERFSPPYNSITPIKIAIHDTINTIRQYVDRSHRIAILVHLYYLGELLSVTTTPRQIWTNYLKEHPLPNHHQYYRTATRVFEIFRENIKQIYRTRFLSMYENIREYVKSCDAC
jgi:hypothetical protein